MLEQGAFRSAAEIPPRLSGKDGRPPAISAHQQDACRAASVFHARFSRDGVGASCPLSREEALQRAGFAVQRIDRAHHFPLSHPVETASLLRMRRDSQQSPPTNAMAADRA
ncbi:hypothetical protein [Brevibacillus agri]|uniref:hypothetical protein n=1 Tax=Brevibacillus agri TaxID=51101 RepID=UPI0025B67DE2|nr:hypothetical protein [Brevibacillus agri]